MIKPQLASNCINMKFTYSLLIVLLFVAFSATAQKSTAVLKATLPEKLKESSGLIFTKHGLWTLNDGAANSIYRVDTITGEILQEIKIGNASFTDAEALAADENYLYIADVGNNNGNRNNLNVIRIAIDSIGDNKEQTLNGAFIQFTYPDQKSYSEDKERNNFDCESMIATKNALYLFTKRRGDNTTTLYALPKKPGNYEAKPVGNFNCYGLVTDAALNNAGNQLLLIGYEKGHKESFIWQFDNVNEPYFFKGKSKLIKLNKGSDEWQTEGICFDSNDRVFISCEKAGSYPAALYMFKVRDKK